MNLAQHTVWHIRCFLTTSVLLCCAPLLLAQSASLPPTTGGELYERVLELQAIEFEGYQETSPQDLVGVIQSRESQSSFTRSLALYYYENLERNAATPDVVMNTLTRVQDEKKDELRYFSEDLARSDSAALLTYLHQNGFHNARVQWRFGFNRERRLNILTFTIDEGTRAVIDTIAYVGFDDVHPDVMRLVDAEKTLRTGDPYSEWQIEQEFRAITAVLQDNGYYRAQYLKPKVLYSPDGLRDSYAVRFIPGPRVRVRQIVFEENANGNPSVHEATRERQLEFGVGDWYSRRKLNLSRSNLMELGAFDVVSIDTVSAAFIDSTGQPDSDSNVAIKVFTKNAKYYDVGANLLWYQTAVDNFLNVGAGAVAQHKNLLGGAQIATLEAQYILQDISRFFQGEPLESEALARFVLAWPNIARIDGTRIGLTTNAYYSLRLLVNPFRLESAGGGATFSSKLYAYTFLNGLDFSLNLERQVPRNFETALDSALSDATSAEDSAYVISTFNQFVILDDYLQKTNNPFTGIFAGVNLRGEHRDSPLNPTRGTQVNISAEVGFGAGQFAKVQFFHTSVHPVKKRLGIATKVRVGHIFLFDFVRGSAVDTNTYVPLERQFFAGGSASIRGYASRRLHDPNSGVIEVDDPNDARILDNVVGSGSLVELGLEFRFRFARPRGLDDLWASLIERSGITLFTDIGNAFNRFTPDLYGAFQLQDLVIGSAMSVGVGYRFETPVGPFRIDYATNLYDPLRSTGQFMWNRERFISFDNWQFQIALGHAF